MLSNLDPASALAIGLLIFSLLLVVAFEATNGFHDAANAVATVIYTKSLGPGSAVVWSGVMNFVGVMVGGISVAYALVELLPAEVLSPPSGAPAVGMLVALFVAALFWNIGTWWFGLPNSSSHCLIGALIGIALGNALIRERSFQDGVHWAQLWTVLQALAFSPLLGFALAGALYFLLRRFVHDPHLYQPAGDKPPVWWMRAILVLTCTGVSFAHGTNDGQKSIGLIMLTIIGLFPALFTLNPEATQSLDALANNARAAVPLIERFGDDEKQRAFEAAEQLQSAMPTAQPVGFAGIPVVDQPVDRELGLKTEAAKQRATVRDDIYQMISQLKHVEEAKGPSPDEKSEAKRLSAELGKTVEYAPWWVRILSALCLGIGTMIGYQRIVTTLGERLGKVHLTPAQGASAELVSAVLIGISGFTGLPVSTTHIVTSGIGGTMAVSGAGLRYGMLSRIVIAWLVTLPVTIVIAATLYYLLDSPRVG
ncbi:MAG: inorganic phosphate transporter [Xanthobacteraceae bacterium]|nr:inorganic phosphate transporter [Xanthobacteraceae bacterium]